MALCSHWLKGDESESNYNYRLNKTDCMCRDVTCVFVCVVVSSGCENCFKTPAGVCGVF